MERLRAVLVGAGGMGRNWARNLLGCEEVELVGWVNIRPEAAAALGLPDIHIASTLAEALRARRPDFVVDVSIPEAHHDNIKSLAMVFAAIESASSGRRVPVRI